MKLTILGKYGPYPKEKGACSSYLLEAAGNKILIDCGSGSLSRLQQFIDLREINMILISHLHFDHISDLFVLRYALEGLKARGAAIKLPLPVYMPDSPQATAELFKNTPVFNVQTITADTKVQIGNLHISFAEMTHPVKSFAMRFTKGSKTLVYSGDTNMNEAIIPFARKADLLLMEAGLLSRDKKDNNAPHISVKEAGVIGREAGVSRLVATHQYPGYDEEEIIKELTSEYRIGEIAQENKTYCI